MKESLFKEFPEVSVEQWKEQIKADLRGADYEKLVYKSPDGIDIQPFYHSEDLIGSIQMPPPGRWNVCERISVDSADEANSKAKAVLEKGAESLWFTVPSPEIDPEDLLSGIDLKQIPVFLSLEFLSEEYIQDLRNYLNNKENNVFLQLDILGNLSRTGNWYSNQEKDQQIFKGVASNSSPFRSVVSVDASLYQNAGANIPQQLAFALAHVNEYLNLLDKEVLKSGEFKPQLIISTGPNYFFEIAKLKALRLLYARLAREYDLPETCFILAEPTRRNKTLYDYNVNLLRTTTETMSAILGGADYVSNIRYDALYRKSNEFSERIARNQALVMKNEAYLEKATNASDGSYYIESLTRQFAEAALRIFKEIESNGGFLKQLQEGVIQKMIRESAEKEQEQFDNGELLLIGTNKFQNPKDRMEKELELDPFQGPIPGNTFLEPILESRLSQKAEQERLGRENSVLT